MRTPEDTLRSLRRFVGKVLGPDYDVQFARTEELERPGAVVRRIGRVLNTGSAYVRDVQGDYQVFIYPPGVEGDASASLIESERVISLMDKAVTAGSVGPPRSYSLRIPVFDYDGVPLGSSLETHGAARVPPVAPVPYDYLVASNWSVDGMVDPDDDTLFTVTAYIRLAWRQDGDIERTQGPALKEIRVRSAPAPSNELRDSLVYRDAPPV